MRARTGLLATIVPVAVGVMLAFGWNLAVSQLRHGATDQSGITLQVGQTVQQAAEEAWAHAMPHGPAGPPAQGGAGGRQGTRPDRSG